MAGRRDMETAGGRTPDPDPQRDLADVTVTNVETADGGATAERQARADNPDRAGRVGGDREDRPGDDQGDPT
jgi:hypothetical protein